MLKVGIAGLGFMGWIHWLGYQKRNDVSVAAICTRQQERRAGDWTGIKGNFGPPGERVDVSGLNTFAELEDMLRDDSIDVVDICLPPALHVEAIVKSAEAGKHVFCEKPLALNLEDCDRAVAACAANGRRLMVGQVLPFFVEYQYAKQIVDSGNYGKLLGGSFKRVISDPAWLNGFYDPQIIGGPLFDLHVHDAHFIRLMFGMPDSVNSCGRIRGEVVDYCNSIFKFADPGVAVTCTGGVINQQGRPFTHGFEIHLEQATLQFDFAGFADTAELMPLKLLKADGTVERPDLGDGDPIFAFEREIGEVVACLSEDRESRVLSGALARDAIEICQMQAKSVMENRMVARNV